MKTAMKRGVLIFPWLSVCALVVFCGPASAVTVNFDALAGGVHQGDALAGSGVTFTTGNIPDAVMVGDTIALAGPDPEFEVFAQPANAVSPPNFATARNVGLNDLLMAFSAPVTGVSLRTDHFSPESADIVRLLALAPTGSANTFRVLAIAEGFDNAVSAPGDTLSVDLGGAPFSYALFQTTTEPEGFDDLTFTFIPVRAPALSERGAILLASVLVLCGMWAIARLRKRSGAEVSHSAT